jgi:hypothetical protein
MFVFIEDSDTSEKGSDEEAAACLKVAPYTVREWLQQGKWGGFKTAKMWRIRQRASDLH